MPYYVKMNGNHMQIITGQEDEFVYRTESSIGEQLLNFVYYDLKKLNDVLDQLYTFDLEKPDTNFNMAFKRLDMENVYLRFFAELFIDAVFLKPGTKEGFNELCRQYQKETEQLKTEKQFTGINYKTIRKTFLIAVISYHALRIQHILRNQLEFCMSNNETYKSLTPSQKLYLFEHWSKSYGEQPTYFETDIYPSRLVLDKPVDLSPGSTREEWAEILQKENPIITEMTVLPGGYMLMRYEMMQLVMRDISLKVCANCGHYFIPQGRSDAEYCTRPVKGQPGKTCQMVGAAIKFQRKSKDNPVFKKYLTAYKRADSSRRIGKMTDAEFATWSKEARVKRDKCLSGEIGQEEFLDWLNENRIYRKRD